MGGILANVPLPANDAIAQPKRPEFGKRSDPQEGKITLPWMDFFTSLGVSVQQAAARVAATVISANASQGATDISSGDLLAGIYRFSYYAQITTEADISSSLTVTLDWVTNGVAQAFSGAAMIGNTTSTNQSGSVLISIDEASPVRYSTVYASTNPNLMFYSLSVTLERLDA